MASIVVAGDTSGTITLSAPAVSGTNTLTLPANTGTVLTTASSGQSIPKAALPTGSVLQVITGTDTSERNTTSTSFGTASNTLSATITPTSNTSKIFIICNTGVFKATGGSGFVTIYRGSTNLGGAGGMAQFQQAVYSSICISYLDSPATTSSTTYQLYFRSSDSNPAYINSNNGGGLVCSLTVFEIAA